MSSGNQKWRKGIRESGQRTMEDYQNRPANAQNQDRRPLNRGDSQFLKDKRSRQDAGREELHARCTKPECIKLQHAVKMMAAELEFYKEENLKLTAKVQERHWILAQQQHNLATKEITSQSINDVETSSSSVIECQTDEMECAGACSWYDQSMSSSKLDKEMNSSDEVTRVWEDPKADSLKQEVKNWSEECTIQEIEEKDDSQKGRTYRSRHQERDDAKCAMAEHNARERKDARNQNRWLEQKEDQQALENFIPRKIQLGESWRHHKGGAIAKQRRRILSETQGDLFTAPKSHSLAHCVAEDMRMGSGIAVTFRQEFKRVGELLEQRKQTGDVAVLKEEGRYIYYLVTKRMSQGKPTYNSLRSSLLKMREHMLANDVHDLSMPRIGCGLDRLNWYEVKMLILEIFDKDDVNITVYNLNQEQGEKMQPKSLLWVKHIDVGLVDMQQGTALLYLGSEDAAISESLQNLLPKYPIPDYRKHNMHVGDIVRNISRKEVLYGLIIRKKENDDFSFTAFSQCLEKLRNMLWKDGYNYVGIDIVSTGDNLELGMEKLTTLFKNAWSRSKLELYICWSKKYATIRDQDRQLESQSSSIS